MDDSLENRVKKGFVSLVAIVSFLASGGCAGGNVVSGFSEGGLNVPVNIAVKKDYGDKGKKVKFSSIKSATDWAGNPKYAVKEVRVPKEWANAYETGRRDNLRPLAELYHFITPDDPLVKQELERVAWMDYGFDEKTNKVLSVVNHVRAIILYQRGSDLLPREVIENGYITDCGGATNLGVSMLIASKIDNENNFFSVYGKHLSYPNRRHGWGIWRPKEGESYTLEFTSKDFLDKLPLDTTIDDYIPQEYANGSFSIQFDYFKI